MMLTELSWPTVVIKKALCIDTFLCCLITFKSWWAINVSCANVLYTSAMNTRTIIRTIIFCNADYVYGTSSVDTHLIKLAGVIATCRDTDIVFTFGTYTTILFALYFRDTN
jgi:hypothetical protein